MMCFWDYKKVITEKIQSYKWYITAIGQKIGGGFVNDLQLNCQVNFQGFE